MILSFVAALHVAHADPAEDAYLDGRKFYDVQEWDQAIEKFKVAYKLRADAASLFNIAQAYRLKGDCAQAVQFYKTYKRNFPDAKNIARVDKWIADLESCASSSKPSDKPFDTKPKGADNQAIRSSDPKPPEPKPAATKPTETKPAESKAIETKPTESKPTESKPTESKPPSNSTGVKPTAMRPTETQLSHRAPMPANKPAVEASSAPAESTSRPRVLTWVAFGVSGAALATGGWFAYRARSQFDEYRTTTDQDRYFALRDQVKSNQRIANISFIAGGGLAVVGAVMFFVEGRHTKNVNVAFDPATSGVYAWGQF